MKLMLCLSPCYSVNTHGNMCYWNRRWCLSWIFHPCSIQDVGSLVCCVFCHRDLTWYHSGKKAHKKTGWGVWRLIVVQYPEDWEICASKHSERLSSDCKDRRLFWVLSEAVKKPLSVTAIKSCLGLPESLGKRNPLLYWLLNHTWLLILIACCIYFYQVLLKKKTF